MRKPIRKRKSTWFLIFLAFCSFVIVIREPLLAIGSKIYLPRLLEKEGFFIESIDIEKNRTTLKGIKGELSGSSIEVKEVEIVWSLSLSPLVLEPSIEILSPKISLKKQDDSSSFDFNAILSKSLFFAPKVSVKGGEVYFPDESLTYAIELVSSDIREELGTLHVFQKGELEEIFRVHIRKDQELVFSEIEIFKAKVSVLRPFVSKVREFSFNSWSSFEGEVSAAMSCIFSLEGVVLGAEGGIELQNLDLQNDEMGFSLRSKALKATALFRPENEVPFWKQLDLFLTFEDSTFLTTKNGSTFGFEESLGELRLHPDTDPYLKSFGSIISKGVRVRFEVEGKGSLLESGAYWLETEADFQGERTSKITLSIRQNEKEESTLQVECSHIEKEVANLMQLIFPIYEVESGELSGKLLGRFEKAEVKSVEFSDCEAKNFVFCFPENDLSLRIGDLSFNGIFEQNTLGALELSSSDVEVHKARLIFKEWEIERIASSLKVRHGEFASSYLEGSYSGIKASLQLLPKTAKGLLHFECGGYLNDFFPSGKRGQFGEKPVFLAMDLQPEDGYASFSGIARFTGDEEEDVEFEGRLDKKISRKFKDLISAWDMASGRGGFLAEKVSTKVIAPYLGEAFKGVQGKGRAQGSFSNKGIELFLSNVDVVFENDQAHVACQINDKDPAYLCYELTRGTWEGVIPFSKVSIEENRRQTSIEVLDCIFNLKKGSLIADGWKAQLGGISVCGSLSIQEKNIQLKTHLIEGKVSSLSLFFPDKNFASLEGDLLSIDGGGMASGIKIKEGWEWEWSLVTGVENISYSLGKGGALDKGEALISANSSGAILVQKAKGLYKIGSIVSDISLGDFYWDEEKGADFSLALMEDGKDLASLIGRLQRKENGYTFAVDSSTHLLGVPLKMTLLSFDTDWKLRPVAGEISLQLKTLPDFFAVAKKAGLPLKEVTGLDGELKIKGFYNPEGSSLDLFCHSPLVSCKGEVLGEVNGKIEKREGLLEVTSQVGTYTLQSSLQTGSKDWVISSFTLESQTGGFFAEGVYTPISSHLSIPLFIASIFNEKGKVELKGDFKGDFSCEQGFIGQGKSGFIVESFKDSIIAKSVNDLEFSFDSNKGFEVQENEWEAEGNAGTLVKASFSKIHALFEGKKIILEEGELSITEKGLDYLPVSFPYPKEKKIEVKFQGEFTKAHKRIKGSIDSSEYSVFETPLEIKGIQFLLENENLYTSCQTRWGKSPCFLQAQSNFGKDPFITVLLKEQIGKPGLAIQLNRSEDGKWLLEGATGAFRGIDIEVQKEEEVYALLMQVDFMQARSLFPEKIAQQLEKMGVGHGYSLHSTFTLEDDSMRLKSLSGEIKGNQFQLLGKVMESFKGKVIFDGNRLSIQNFILEDEIGFLTVKALEIYETEGEIVLAAPLLYVKEFSPSLFTQGKKEGAVIKNLSMYNLRGALGNLENLEGVGALNFLSSEVKEFTSWDVPKGVLKDLGLAPSLLTPVSGELDFRLSEGKMFITALRNTYSEGRQSQFDLASVSSPSYLTLDGTVCVDLKMKQNAVLKVAEGFILSIRGNLENPKYSFKLKEAL